MASGSHMMVCGQRRVVLVAPEFPPSNSAGAHRPRLFAKHLPAFGWTPTVLTIRPEQIEGPLDPMLERLLDPALTIVRTAALPIKPLRIIGDLGLRSLPAHARALTSMIRRGTVGTLVLFGPPWFSFALGPMMKRRFGIPYVVDYIDPWITASSAARPFPEKAWFYHRAAAAIEPSVLRSAAHVTAVSEGILEDLRGRYPWLDGERMSAMPYGAEPDDLEAAARLGLAPPDFSGDDDDVTISFTGAVQPTSHALVTAVLRALGALDESRPATRRRTRLRAYGTSNLTWGHGRYTILPVAREVGVDHLVSEIPERIPYLQAMAVLQTCGIVLVMGSTDAYYHASKLYPAIVSGRPILAVCHRDSSIKRVIEQTGAGMCVAFSDPVELQSRIGEIASAIESLAGRPRRKPDAAAIEPFTARASTASLARVLDQMTGRPALAEAI
jgi:glycosyl transferase family 4